MINQPAIYETRGRKYHADRCKQLVEAVDEGKVCLEALARGGYPGEKLRTGELPGVLSVGYWDAIGVQRWGLDWHRNEGIELTFLETGQMPFSVGKKCYLLKSGDMTISRPWQPHRVGNPHVGYGRLCWLILDVNVRRPHQKWIWPKWLVLNGQDIKLLTTLLSHNEQSVWQATAELRQCFAQISSCITTKEHVRRISRLTVLINELFVLLLEMFDKRRMSLRSELTSTRRTVELFLADLLNDKKRLSELWTVESMADQCGLGVTHFSKLCKQITNMTPIQYLNYYRIEAAGKLLLQDNHASVTDIAMNCGFTSSQYFATVFRSYKSISPRMYRKRNT